VTTDYAERIEPVAPVADVDCSPPAPRLSADGVAGLRARGETLLRAGVFGDAAEVFAEALRLAPGDRRARLGWNRAMRCLVPRWHFAMMNDVERNAAFEAAIESVVRPGSLVLDIGAGSGLLALMAARAGADRVVTCEAVPQVAAVAQEIVADNGLTDRIQVVAKPSYDLRVGIELPRPADVLTTETVDCGLLGEGIVPTVEHARGHLLGPDAVVVPRRGAVLAQLVQSPELHRMNAVELVSGFDLSEFNQLATAEYFSFRLRTVPHSRLSEPVELFSFDFEQGPLAPERRSVRVEPVAGGHCHAVVFWFSLDLVPGIVLSNGPDNSASHWRQAVQCLPAPLPVRAGQPVNLIVSQDREHVFVERVAALGAA
jgi:protein arginine N-methyltransferase 7